MDNNTSPSISAILGRQLPYSVENEQALLGALILDSERLGDVSSVLNSQDFYIDKHRSIYSALIDLSLQNRGVDVVTLLSLLVQKGVYTEESGASYIRQLAENVPSLSNIMDYAAIIREKSMLRRLIQAAEEIMEDAYAQQGETTRIIDSAQQKIFDLTKDVAKQDFTKIDEIIQQFYVELKELSSGDQNTKTIKTYFGDLDRVLVGMNPGDLILVGARPGMGKTSFVMNIASEVAKRRRDKSVAIFSMEMSKTQLASRLLSSEGRIESRKLRDGQLEEEDLAKLAEAAVALSQTNIYIDESGNLSPVAMRTKLRRIPNLGLVPAAVATATAATAATTAATTTAATAATTAAATAAATAATTTSTTTAAHGVSREDLGEVRRESQDVREVGCHLLLGGPLYIFRS